MPGLNSACKKSHQRSAHSPGRAASGPFADIAAELCRDHVAIAPERLIQLGDHLGRRSFLRAKNGGRAGRTAQRIGHIARNRQRAGGQPRVQPGTIDGAKLRQRRSACPNRQQLSRVIVKPYAYRLQ